MELNKVRRTLIMLFSVFDWVTFSGLLVVSHGRHHFIVEEIVHKNGPGDIEL